MLAVGDGGNGLQHLTASKEQYSLETGATMLSHCLNLTNVTSCRKAIARNYLFNSLRDKVGKLETLIWPTSVSENVQELSL